MRVNDARSDAAVRNTSIVIALKDDVRIFDCLASVNEEVEVVIVMNGTPPELRERLQVYEPRPVLTESDEVGNLGAAYNAGIALASGRYILLMDSDCRFGQATIRKMASLVCQYGVVKGKVVYGEAPSLVSRLIARIREFDEGDYVSALSPPLLYDRQLAERIGGYHFNPFIHWCEDREFDFRLQMANIPVWYEESAVIFHHAQVGAQDLRSYWRYGIGEGIGQELGVFTTPAIPLLWRALSDCSIIIACARAKGSLAALYYVVTLGAFHAGTTWHLLADPYRVRRRYPPGARRVRILASIPQHCTSLTDKQKRTLGAQHASTGNPIVEADDYRNRFDHLQAELREAAATCLRGVDHSPGPERLPSNFPGVQF